MSTHPTKAKLLDTAVSLIDEFGPIGFTVDALLERSGISKGSLYHHFVDFSDVIEQAQVIRFSRYIDEDINALFEMLSSANSGAELRERFESVVLATSDPSRADARSDRATIVGLARHSKNFADALGREQQRVTDALADIAREAQERGFIRQDVDVRVLATFVQTYTLGFVLNDITVDPIASRDWAEFVGAMLAASL
jgi:AcrR family transcriptional regulator